MIRWSVDVLGSSIDLRNRDSQDPGRILNDVLILEVSKSGNGGYVSIASAHVVLYFVPSLIFKVQVNIREVIALGINESFEDQLFGHWIDSCNAKSIVH